MTKNEIILIADASGIAYYGMGKDREKFIYYLEAFAALVAEREREKCAKVCEEKYEYYGPCPMAEAIRARGENT